MREWAGGRKAGVLLPLSSFPGTTSWGIGEIGDIRAMTDWLEAAGLRALQVLPLNEMAADQQSPYSALSALAIDPLYISMAEVPEFGGESTLSAGERSLLGRIRDSAAIDYAAVRRLKRQALRAACERFLDAERRHDTDRSRAFTGFLGEQSWWIDDYATFRALHAYHGDASWTTWPEPLKRRDAAALAEARHDLAAEIAFYQYLQWIAHQQWQQARAGARGVALLGDLPFMVDGDSADVWARQDQFRLDASVGAPPDAFSATGQNWGMPVYEWDVIERDGFGWLRDRARRAAELYDGYRVDHVVGFYRTYGWPADDSEPFFTPAEEPAQIALGERVLNVFREPGAHVIAEDLGIIPDFVRASMARLGVPGFRVLRWERLWHAAGQPFRDPSEYPPLSVAVSGTHDTETMAVWWEHALPVERELVWALPTMKKLARDQTPPPDGKYDVSVRDVLLESLYASGSDLVLLPIQDLFGWRDRINEPGAVNEDNWTFRLPWPVDRLAEVAEARERQACLRAWATKHAR
jgi:4-alpha-glucanotransferase